MYLVGDNGKSFAHYPVQLPTEQLKLYRNKLAYHDPLDPARFNDGISNVVTLEVAQKDFDSRIYVDTFLNAFDLPHEVELFFRDSQNRIVAGMGLFRSSRTGYFRLSEIDLLTRVRPLAECAFRLIAPNRRSGLVLSETYGLTRREEEVINLVRQGDSNMAVAVALGIRVATVKAHLFNAYEKLGVSSRTELLSRLHALGH